MNRSDLKKELYKYWDTSQAYYEIAEELHDNIQAKRKELFTDIKEGAKILDVACGSGTNRKDLPEKISYCGIDLSFAGLSVGRRSHSDASFVKADAEKLPLTDSFFDYVVSTNAVEHFIEPRFVFNEMWRVCKRGGSILLIFPNYGDYIFKYPPSVSYMMRKPWYRIRYIAKQFYHQTMRMFSKKSFSFVKIDILPDVLMNPYSPDTDIVYLASGREVKNYFTMLGASSIRVDSKERLTFARPILGNMLKNIFRIFKAMNPYYSWHGDTILVIKK